MCTECGMVICKECHATHDESHMRKLLRFRTIQWMANLSGVAASVSCWYCVKDTKVRWQCDKCEYALCTRCARKLDRRDQFLKDHEQNHPDHRTFLAIYPPYWTTAQRWIQDKCPCLDVQPTAAGHCERCHTGRQMKRRFYRFGLTNRFFGQLPQSALEFTTVARVWHNLDLLRSFAQIATKAISHICPATNG
jgi:hypothetical protein